MESLQNETSQMFLIMFQDQRSYKIKISAINRLIQASGANVASVFGIWREKNRQINIFNAVQG